MSAALLLDPITSAAPEAVEPQRRTLVIGDIHGHLDRFEALLKQEGIIGTCPFCDGLGDISQDHSRDHSLPDWIDKSKLPDSIHCPRCEGDGICRIDYKTRVILVGDVGHFGKDGSPTGDMLTWRYADRWVDEITWGNHDRAVFEDWHAFQGLQKGDIVTEHIMRSMVAEDRLLLATAAWGFLITHAGLHGAFEKQDVDDNLKHDAQAFADWINEINEPNSIGTVDQMAVRDAISERRGGRSPYGGIIWRHIEEKLFMGFPQIFGHSADHKEHKVRYCWYKQHSRHPGQLDGRPSYCVDVGGSGKNKGDNCLAGIYLPDEQIVRIDL